MLSSHLIVKTSPEANTKNIVRFGNIRVSVLGERLFRLECDTEGEFCDEATRTIWFRDMAPVDFIAEKNGDRLVVKTAAATLTVYPDIMSSTVITECGEVMLSEIKNLPGAYRSLDRCNGDTYTHKKSNQEYEIKLEDGIVSESGVGLYNDTAALILGTDGRLHPRRETEADLYIFAHGRDFRGALRDLYTVSGKVPVIPRYAFGNWWSRYHVYTDKEYLHVLDKLAERDIPFTVATIDMDWHWSRTLDARKKITESGKADEFHGGASGWTGYSWNTDLFPDYKAFLRKIKDRNLKITLNLHPATGVRYFEDMYPEMARAVGIDPESEAVVPFDFTSDDFINAYFEILHKPYEHDGVEFWWIDWQQGTKTAMPGLDPLFALNHYHTLDNALEHTPLILSRYCEIGSHRYPLGFSGDTHTTWTSLAYIPYFTAMGTNAGYTWWSHDIGGHMCGYKDDNLYTRYVQFGTFSPINRLHCSSLTTTTKEPMVYMNGAGLVAEEFLRLRHRMIPFLYSESVITHRIGRALIEPMYYPYPNDAEAYNCPAQYYFGDMMIVAPIATPPDSNGMSEINVWLPEGKWTDIFTGDRYEGGARVDMVRWLDSIPVLAKEGTVFPLDGRRHTNDVELPDIFDLLVFSGSGEYTLYEGDEGNTMNTKFTVSQNGAENILTIKADGNTDLIKSRSYRVQMRNIRLADSVKVTIDGNACDIYVDDAGDYIEFTVNDVPTAAELVITVNESIDPERDRRARLLYNYQRIIGDNEEKEAFMCKLKRMDKAAFYKAVDRREDYTPLMKKRIKEAMF